MRLRTTLGMDTAQNLSRSYDKNVVGTANELWLVLFLIDWARMSD